MLRDSGIEMFRAKGIGMPGRWGHKSLGFNTQGFSFGSGAVDTGFSSFMQTVVEMLCVSI